MTFKKSKALICVALAAVITGTALTACSFRPEAPTEATESVTAEATTETTTEPTTVTTTENTATTFPESETRKIYKGLSKDEEGSYDNLVSSYSTYYHSYDVTRTENLKNSVRKINNIVVPDGQVFSFNQTVGKRTVTAGYKEAKVIAEGEFVDGLGGGVCQVSSTIFDAVLRANVKIVARTYHSLEISYVPLGGDATVQWNSKDFQFENNLGTDIRLQMYCSDGKLTCEVYSKKKVDTGDVDISIFRDGSSYVLVRKVNGKENYRTVSHYSKPKPSTTKATTKKDEKKDEKKEEKEEKTTKKEKEETTKKKKEETTKKEKNEG
ncbi:MAG: VanW family protein [Eubacterium sp.]|nr:VanW family protein [Eubacterium sp.]